MTAGDTAASIGWPTVNPATGLVKDGAAEINTSRDLAATHVISGTHPASAITSGTLDAARIPNIDAAKITTGTLTRPVNVAGNVNAVNVIASGQIESAGSLVTFGGLGIGSTGAGFTSGGALYSPDARANGVSGGLAIYVDASGLIRKSTSSKRYKKAIKKMTPDLQAILAMELVEFQWKATGEVDQGVIAEQLEDLGLEWLVFRDETGRVDGVRYERIALALLAVTQDHERRLAALEAKE